MASFRAWRRSQEYAKYAAERHAFLKTQLAGEPGNAELAEEAAQLSAWLADVAPNLAVERERTAVGNERAARAMLAAEEAEAAEAVEFDGGRRTYPSLHTYSCTYVPAHPEYGCLAVHIHRSSWTTMRNCLPSTTRRSVCARTEGRSVLQNGRSSRSGCTTASVLLASLVLRHHPDLIRTAAFFLTHL